LETSLRKVLLTSLLLIASISACAQSLVEGWIRDNKGAHLPAAAVVLKHGNVQIRTETSADGHFRFLGVEPGEYEITASATGYYSAETEFVARPRQPVVVQLELAPRTSANTRVEVHSADIASAESTGSRLLTHAELQALPSNQKRDLPTLALYTFPGATLSHDNFVHVRGNEVSLQEFINGISFLENPQEQFSPGLSPEMFQTMEMVSGMFPAEYGNRFGGVVDATTRAGFDLNGHGSISLGVGTFKSNDASAEYGGTKGRFGYYVFAGGLTSDWYLNPPEPRQLHDFGFGGRGGAQLDYRMANDTLSLLVTGGGTNFELPNLAEDQAVGRNSMKRLRSETAIASWQHTFSPRALLNTSVYERTLEDRLVPTTDPITPYADGLRNSLTAGIKSDLVVAHGKHTFKAGVDLTRLRLRESFNFDSREVPLPSEDPPAFNFRSGVMGGQASLYAQDRISLTPNLTTEFGLRYDYFDLTDTFTQVSPRFSVAYHVPSSRTTLHFAYNRFFSPPQLEYVQLANFFGQFAPEPGDRVGRVKPYRQNYYELGVSQEVHPKVSLDVTGFYHTGDTPFEYREISISRLFLPINSSEARSYGVQAALALKQLQSIGLTARLQYAYQRTFFYGPIAGGFAVGEEILPGEKFLPAFDEPNSGTLMVRWTRPWRNVFGGFNLRYGSGTAVDNGASRVPAHTTADLSGGFDLWQREAKRVQFELTLTDLGDNRYAIAKESEETPIQYAPPRIAAAHLKWYF
jgi:hypothetical protein